MAYYYLTSDFSIYKTAGARKVRLIDRSCYKKTFEEKMVKVLSDEITREIDNSIVQSICGILGKTSYNAGIVYAPYIPVYSVKIIKPYKEKRYIPIHIFKRQHGIICETSNFDMIVFELAMKEL